MSAVLFFYIFRQLMVMTLYISGILITCVWMIQSLRFVDLVLNARGGLGAFFQLAVLALPDLLVLVLPLTFFVAILFVYGRLMTERESVALQGAGLSFLGLSVPPVVGAFVMSTLLYGLTLFACPTAMRGLKDLESTLRNTLPAQLIHEGVFTMFKNVTVYVQKKKHNHLEGVFAHIYEPQTHKSYSVMAQKGEILDTPEGMQLLMTMGNRQDISKGKFSILYFDQSIVSLAQFEGNSKFRKKTAYEMPLSELVFPDPTYSHEQKRLFRAEGHQRLLNPLLSPCFALIALVFLFCAPFSRRGLARPIIRAVTTVVVMQVSLLGIASISTRFEYAIYLNYAMVALVSAFCLWRLRQGPRLLG